MLTAEQSAFVSGYVKNETKAVSRDAIGNQAARKLQDEVVDILTAAHRHGVSDMTVQEIAAQYHRNTGRFKPPSSFNDTVGKLRAAKRLEFAGTRTNIETGRLNDCWRLVAQQSRLAA